MTYLNNETWTYECVVTPKEGDYYSKGYERLFDLNATAWATFNHYDFLKYEITVDMQETKRVNGFAMPLILQLLQENGLLWHEKYRSSFLSMEVSGLRQ